MLALEIFLIFVMIFRSVAAVDIMQYKTFQTKALPLRSGQIVNTASELQPNPLYIPWLDFPAAIRQFQAELVDDSGNLISLAEVYVHHWLIFDNNFNAGLCGNMQNKFGIGAELYGSNYSFPAPYALVTTGKEVWTGNVHLIRTTNVVDVQSCIECHCADSRPPQFPHGQVGCCPDGAQCWGMENSTLNDTKNYYLRYTIGYSEITPDILPLSVFALDATATHTIDCETEYDIPGLSPGQINVLQTFAVIPDAMSIVYINLHLHIGGVNFTMEHFRGGVSQGVFCVVVPEYGDGSGPKSPQGYLIRMAPCIFQPGATRDLLAGDQLQLTAIYSGLTIPGGHNYHEGVMSLAFIYASADIPLSQQCITRIYDVCGVPPYVQNYCYVCVQYYNATYFSGLCSTAVIESQCSQSSSGWSWPVPAATPNITLSLLFGDGPLMFVNITGPSEYWFAMAVTINSTVMNGAMAYISTVDDNHFHVLEQRSLGNHELGPIIAPIFPADISTLPSGKIQILFNMSFNPYLNPTPSGPRFISQELLNDTANVPYFCILVAEGSETSGMTPAYHGSQRGWVCANT